jgi:hypothetical protein
MATSTATAAVTEEVDVAYPNVYLEASKAVQQKRRTVLKKFDDYLSRMNKSNDVLYPYKTFEEIKNNTSNLGTYIDENLLGGFASYLYIDAGLKCNTALTYLSNIFGLLEKEHRFQIRDDFIRQCRSKLEDKYVKKAHEEGTEVASQAPPLKYHELQAFCSILFEENTPNSLQTRAAIILQWQSIGRVGEMLTGKTSDFAYTQERKIRAIMVRYLKICTNICYMYI